MFNVGQRGVLPFWSVEFTSGEAGVHRRDVGMLLVPLRGLIEILVEHG